MRDIFEYENNFATFKAIESVLIWHKDDCPQQPKVSIIMPVYNHSDFFRIALSSAIAQSYADDYEIVVVDNNPLSDTKTPHQLIAESFDSNKVRYYRNRENIGMFGNWNRSIELARAPFVVFLHDDDMLLPHALEVLMKIQMTSGDKAIFSSYNKINEKGEIIGRADKTDISVYRIFRKKTIYEYSIFNEFVSSPGFGIGCLFSRRCLLEIGGYSPEFYPSSDYALNAAYTRKFGSVYNCTPTFNYRIAENESINIYDQFAEMDKHFKHCMMKHINLPNLLLKAFINAQYRINTVNFAVKWGKKDRQEFPHAKFKDRLIVGLFNKYHSLCGYKFSLS